MGDAGKTQRGVFGKRRRQLRQGVSAVTYAHAPAHVQLLFQRWAERANGDIDRLIPLQLCLCLTGMEGRFNT